MTPHIGSVRMTRLMKGEAQFSSDRHDEAVDPCPHGQ
jgi:hypothetical protein